MGPLVIALIFLILATGPARADPLSIGVALLVNIGYGGAISGFGATLLGSAVLGGLAVGASLLSSAIFTSRAPSPSPSERQVVLRQSVGARVRSYGRVKVGGTLFFLETRNGTLYSGQTVNEGKISAFVEYWLNDQLVTVDSAGTVQENPYFGNGQVASIITRDGDSSQTAYAELTAAFSPDYTSAHRLRGTATALLVLDEVPQDKIAEVYPQLDPKLRVVIDASLVAPLSGGSKVWSDNPATCIYDYLVGVDDAGFAYGAGFYEAEVDLVSFQHLATLADEAVPTKAGGTIKRYRLWGSYGMNEEMRAVLPRMLATCDGDLYLTSDGKIGIRGGEWIEPTLVLDDQLGHIIAGDWNRGAGALAAFNELTVTYTEPDLDYQDAEAERWVDTANVALLGRVRPDSLDLPMVPHHAQARRLAKIHTVKNNPEWQGKIVTNFYGFNAIGERTVRIKFSALGINDTFLIRSVAILPDMTGCEITVSSLSADAYAWDAETEEGTAPAIPPDTSSAVELPPPEDINVSVAERAGSTYLEMTWTEPVRTSLSQEVQFRINPDGIWTNMTADEGIGLAESPAVEAGIDYDLRIRTISPGGRAGPWLEPVITVTGTADVSAPSTVTSLSAVPGEGLVALTWVNSVSSNTIASRVYRNTTNDSGTADLVATRYGSPGVSLAFTDEPLTAGTYYYWISAMNGSDVESTLVASGAQVVT